MVYFSGLVGEVCGCEGRKGDKERLGPERRELLTHDGRLAIYSRVYYEESVIELPETFRASPSPLYISFPPQRTHTNQAALQHCLKYSRSLQKGSTKGRKGHTKSFIGFRERSYGNESMLLWIRRSTLTYDDLGKPDAVSMALPVRVTSPSATAFWVTTSLVAVWRIDCDRNEYGEADDN
jgi:hypothetical protein